MPRTHALTRADAEVETRTRRFPWPLVAAGASVIFVTAVLWARTGMVPAASGGDEVWWSESGYQFLHGGVLRWACLDDDNGSGVMSFWPPDAPLLQALMMRIFGVNAFGIYAQSSLVCTLIMLGVYLLCRKLALERTPALCASVAIFGLSIVEREATQVRMDNLTALATIVYAGLIISSAEADRRGKQFILGILAGLTLGIGLFAYYPQSPFFLLACLAAVPIVARKSMLFTFLAVGLGCAPVILSGLIWILPHWIMFKRQVLDAGTGYYFALGNVASPFTALIDVSQKFGWLESVERWLVLALAVIVGILGQSTRLKAVSVMTFFSSLPMFAYVHAPQDSAGILGVVLLFGLIRENSIPNWRVAFKAIAGALMLLALIGFALIGLTAFWQRDGRDYQVVQTELRRVVKPGAPVATSQRGWLGLREVIPSQDLHFLVYSGASLKNMPQAAKNPQADHYFKWLVLERNLLPVLKRLYPWLDRGIASGEFRLVEEINPPFRPLPWARERCYDLMIYERTP